MADLITEVNRFRVWAETASPAPERSGDWECGYEDWQTLYDTVLKFVASRPLASWSDVELQAVLYAIARDNESQCLASDIRQEHPELVPPLARAALQIGEKDDRWQLAVELGKLGASAEVEQLLLELASDNCEYVRRQALRSLLMVGSPAVESLALAAWRRPDEHQEWARMMALFCLNTIASPHLESLLAEAERDTRQYLRGYAERIRRGDPVN
jgi:HEAT repeat protein